MYQAGCRLEPTLSSSFSRLEPSLLLSSSLSALDVVEMKGKENKKTLSSSFLSVSALDVEVVVVLVVLVVLVVVVVLAVVLVVVVVLKGLKEVY